MEKYNISVDDETTNSKMYLQKDSELNKNQNLY